MYSNKARQHSQKCTEALCRDSHRSNFIFITIYEEGMQYHAGGHRHYLTRLQTLGQATLERDSDKVICELGKVRNFARIAQFNVTASQASSQLHSSITFLITTRQSPTLV